MKKLNGLNVLEVNDVDLHIEKGVELYVDVASKFVQLAITATLVQAPHYSNRIVFSYDEFGLEVGCDPVFKAKLTDDTFECFSAMVKSFYQLAIVAGV